MGFANVCVIRPSFRLRAANAGFQDAQVAPLERHGLAALLLALMGAIEGFHHQHQGTSLLMTEAALAVKAALAVEATLAVDVALEMQMVLKVAHVGMIVKVDHCELHVDVQLNARLLCDGGGAPGRGCRVRSGRRATTVCRGTSATW